ncbi:invasion associated locus B family protein, partial [Mesorhizobium sp. M2A.F.Ca.ET.039.01.1.1]
MTINAYRLSVLAAGVVGVLGAGLFTASAQQQPQIPQGWFKACTKQA